MWWRESREHCVGFHQPGSGYEQLLAIIQACFHLPDSTLMLFCANHTQQ